MDFSNLESEETLKQGLNWIAECIGSAMERKENNLKFTFTPNDKNTLEDIFEFCLKLKENLFEYGMKCWCILDNKDEVVNMKIFF